ncbi:Hypothetical protein FKW44_003283 [Caligus rogercresseyi]|uniref:Uncharacterized protein n=1 Tax=Caligus rogercresseyi TaxID=217165 RepID=A0A7T8KLF9_CALRO|nr:Hypothetical protein FKW44_003283 [Caligus rogercresseyi]
MNIYLFLESVIPSLQKEVEVAIKKNASLQDSLPAHLPPPKNATLTKKDVPLQAGSPEQLEKNNKKQQQLQTQKKRRSDPEEKGVALEPTLKQENPSTIEKQPRKIKPSPPLQVVNNNVGGGGVHV